MKKTTKSGSIAFAGDVERTKKKVEDRSRIDMGNSLQSWQIFMLLSAEEKLRNELFVRFP